MCKWCFALPIACAVALADSARQTDWSGGPSIPTPVTEWESDFGPGDLLDWLNAPGCLTLDLEQVDLASGQIALGELVGADLDGDGLTDVIGSYSNNPVRWFRNTGTELPWPCHLVYDGGCNYFAPPSPADMDGDGDPDVLISDSDHRILWAENPLPDSVWAVHPVCEPPTDIRSMHAADIDNDGDQDVFGAGTMDDWVGWWENTDGAGDSWVEHLIDTDVLCPYSIEACDVDMDGDVDLVLVDVTDQEDRARWYENTGPPWSDWPKHLINDAISKPRQVTAFEMNGEPGAELLMNSVNADEICWYSQDGPDNWTEHLIAAESTVWRAYPVDLDMDGDIDVVARQGGRQAVFWNRGSGVWDKEFLTLWGHPRESMALDYEPDGHPEILVAHAEYGPAEPASLTAYELERFTSSGYVSSVVLDTGGGQDWGEITWESVQLPGTSVGFQVRSGAVYTLMRDWSDTLSAPGSLQGTLVDGDRYLQYRAILSTSDPFLTPELNEVTITWDPTGIGGSGATDHWLSGPFPNPARSDSRIELDLAETAFVRIVVFDVAGRLVETLVDDHLDPGSYSLCVPLLPSGVYLLRASSGSSVDTVKFLVLE